LLPARARLSPRTHWRNHRRVRRRASGRSHYNYFRDYDPATGRYVESDPAGLKGGVNTYAYGYGSPVTWDDPLGLKPGDSFPSPEAAAIDALNYINTKSDCGKREYFNWIWKEWSLFGNPTYTYDEPTGLGPAGGVVPPKPMYHDVYAMAHNHPPLPGYDSDNYSTADEDTADANNVPSYLEIPSGIIKRYTPAPGVPRGFRESTVGKASCSCQR
jgi:RHS repeat-associated protein